jgi:hypothetical protein
LTDCFTDIKTPITIVSARGDCFSPPAAGARLASLLSDAKHIEIDGQSHAVFLEQRAALMGILSDLLTPPYVPYAWEVEQAESESTDGETVEESQDLTLEHVAGIEQVISDGLSVETGRSSEIDQADEVGVSPEGTPSDQHIGASGPESAEERAVVPDAAKPADEAPKLEV